MPPGGGVISGYHFGNGQACVFNVVYLNRSHNCVVTVNAVSTADIRDDDAGDEYDPYLTIRRNFQHANDGFTSVMWLRKVFTITSCCRLVGVIIIFGLSEIKLVLLQRSCNKLRQPTFSPCTNPHYLGWFRGTVVERWSTLVYDRRTFRPALDLQLMGDHLRG